MLKVRPPCEVNNGGCQHWCAHIKGVGYKCVCEPGYKLDKDRKSCVRK